MGGKEKTVKRFFYSIIFIVLLLALFVGLVFLDFKKTTWHTDFSSPHPQISFLENIYGQPLTVTSKGSLLENDLSHFKIYLKKSPIAKDMQISVNFSDSPADIFALGLRKGEFWLDYEKKLLENNEAATFDLDSAYLNQDHSLDLMFFAPDLEKMKGKIWIKEIKVEIKKGNFTYLEAKNLLKNRYQSIIKWKEKLLKK